MNALDFCYDGQYLSDYGFMIANIDKQKDKTVIETGCKLSFTMKRNHSGKKYTLVNTKYEKCYTTTFQICKNPDKTKDLEITSDEFRDIMRWLNRRNFYEFSFIPLDDEETEKYYFGSFNLKKIFIGYALIGIELTLETNTPYAYGNILTYTFNVADTTQTFLIADFSDEIGHIYPETTIEIHQPGNFQMYNELTGETTIINNCYLNEKIHMRADATYIETDMDRHKNSLMKDFNGVFPKIANTYGSRQNRYKISLPCSVTMTYRPIIK